MKRVLVVVLALLWSGIANAQQVAYAASVSEGTELDGATQAALTAEFSRARSRGVPVEPLMSKVREGRLKRAEGARIVRAVSTLAVRLDSARVALGPESTMDEIVAGADALQAKSTMASLRAIRAASTRPVAVPLGALAQLTASGVSSARAAEMIVALIRKNATPAMVVALGNLVEADVASGLRADEAAIFRLRGIDGSISFGDKLTISESAPAGVLPPTSRPPPKPTRRP